MGRLPVAATNRGAVVRRRTVCTSHHRNMLRATIGFHARRNDRSSMLSFGEPRTRQCRSSRRRSWQNFATDLGMGRGLPALRKGSGGLTSPGPFSTVSRGENPRRRISNLCSCERGDSNPHELCSPHPKCGASTRFRHARVRRRIARSTSDDGSRSRSASGSSDREDACSRGGCRCGCR
jgi:hypothetical protein